MERRYKRSRYKLMIADHLLPSGNHDTPSPGNTPCVSHRGKGKALEQNWGAESEEEGKESNREENPLGHLAQVVPEGQLPLQGNEAPGKCVGISALCRIKLLPVTHVLVDMWMVTVKPVTKL